MNEREYLINKIIEAQTVFTQRLLFMQSLSNDRTTVVGTGAYRASIVKDLDTAYINLQGSVRLFGKIFGFSFIPVDDVYGSDENKEAYDEAIQAYADHLQYHIRLQKEAGTVSDSVKERAVKKRPSTPKKTEPVNEFFELVKQKPTKVAIGDPSGSKSTEVTKPKRKSRKVI